MVISFCEFIQDRIVDSFLSYYKARGTSTDYNRVYDNLNRF